MWLRNPSWEQSNVSIIVPIVHFKRLGSRCFYDLFECCYFFFLNRYALSKTNHKTFGDNFFKIFYEGILNVF